MFLRRIAFVAMLATPIFAASNQNHIRSENLSSIGDRLLVGYWHNFNNGSTVIRLGEVSPAFDIIEIAFAEPLHGDYEMAFTPFNASESEFKSDIKSLQEKGKKVLISVGGANGVIRLSDETKRRNFVTSMAKIIRDYSFDGIDIDLEGSSLHLDAGDNDFRNPKTPEIVNLISAVQDLQGIFSGKLLLTMAPETYYVQVGTVVYGGPAGAYLPVIHALRDSITLLQVQHYNSGSITGLDDVNYEAGTADFHVALADILLSGFAVAKDNTQFFPPLREDQVVIGLPAAPPAAGRGYTPPEDVQKAFRYLATGESYGGRYQLRNPSGYPRVRGLMTWSINWDAAHSFEFSRNHREFLDKLDQ